MTKYLIFGNGYIGNKFKSRLGDEAILTRTDITDAGAVRSDIETHKPDVVINCAGKTGKPNVDWCEDHKLETWSSNVLGPIVLAKVCLETDTFLAHIGSGCVYEGDGNTFFAEGDEPNFFGSFYSRTKFLSEKALKEFPILQLRLRMPVDSVPGPRNLITKITKYPKIISVPNSVSILDDFLDASLELIKKRRTGIYNVTNPGCIEHKEILDLYKEIVDPSFTYEIMSLEELGRITKAKRSNCVLDTKKLEAEFKMPPVKEAMRRVLAEYEKNLN